MSIPDEVVDTDRWWHHAACRGMSVNLFMPETGSTVRNRYGGINHRSSASRALAVCAECPVRQPCLEEAVRLGRLAIGIWGGTTLLERERMRGNRANRGPKG